MYQPKTGQKCSCKRGVHRDNCPTCEGTGWVVDFRAIHAAKSTPGPWRVSYAATQDGQGGGGYYRIEASGRFVARTAPQVSGPVDAANAHLIAAAPDLLGALYCISRGLTNGQIERGETFQSIARAAIAKAEGK